MRMPLALATTLTLTTSVVGAQPDGSQPMPVTVDNFVRAETNLYFGNALKDSVVLATFHHRR